LVLFGVLVWHLPSTSRADLRAAAKKLIPATVRITRVETAVKKGKTSASPRGEKEGAVITNSKDTLVTGGIVVTSDALRLQPGQQLNLELNDSKVSAVSFWCGVVVNADGWIVTVADGRGDGKLEVTLADGRILSAQVVVDDRRTGLVLLKADAKGVPVVPLANDPVEIGEDIVASIADGPKSRLIARGIVTALGRHFGNARPLLIQSDLPRSAATAGVPVANSSGDLVGVVLTAPGAENCTFVVPVAHVKSLLAAPGLVLQAYPPAHPIVIESGVMGITLHGQLVLENVHADLPAAKAGLRKGDEISMIDGLAFASTDELTDYIRMQTPGTKLAVKYRRGGKELSADVVLAPPDKPKTYLKSVASEFPGPTTFYIWNAQAPANLQTGVNLTQGGPNANGVIFSPDVQTPINLSTGPNANGIIFTPVAVGNVNYAAPPVMRVEKTDAEKRIDELSIDVKSLQGGIDALRSQMDALNKHLKELTKTLKKN